MKHSRLFVAALAAVIALPVVAQDFPSKQPIRLVVGFATGGGTDAIARAMNTRMGEILKQSVVVENRGGAGGVMRSRGTTTGTRWLALVPSSGRAPSLSPQNHSWPSFVRANE